MIIKEIDPNGQKRIDDFIIAHWYTVTMIVRGECVNLGTAKGWYAEENYDIVGLITYRIVGEEMEILSLDSLRENVGIGTALLNQAIDKARQSGCRRVTLITTNDNLNALRFYQKRGFDLVCIHRNALDISRKLKPEIPVIGIDGIPLRHEIEMEYRF